MSKDAPENWSVVAKIYEQVRALEDGGVDNIRSGYVEGTFTQDNPIARYIDGISGYTFDRRVETAYDHDRKSVVKGKSVSVRVDLVGRRSIKKKKTLKRINIK